jgi:MinD superfamily P-loop ATPase
VVASATYASVAPENENGPRTVMFHRCFEVAYNRGKLVEPRRSARGGCVSSEEVRDDEEVPSVDVSVDENLCQGHARCNLICPEQAVTTTG